MNAAPPPLPFDRFGQDPPVSPVVLSVSHAGRRYPGELLAMLNLPLERIRALEDRYVDAVAHAARRDETMLIARHPRAWIDLNRSEHERDPRIDHGAPRLPIGRSDKVRSGLGIIPRRAGGVENIWRRKFDDDEVRGRIGSDHAPYHAILSHLLTRARARFGIAILLDIHSMPPLAGASSPVVVVGDRFGRSCDPRVTAAVVDAAVRAGWDAARNAPYAGGYILERHASPIRQVHAVQLEIDRTLYLDSALDQPGSGLDRTAGFVRAVIDALSVIAHSHAFPAAAE